jgi:hypothetical protein
MILQELNLSRVFFAAPGARLGHLMLEGQRRRSAHGRASAEVIEAVDVWKGCGVSLPAGFQVRCHCGPELPVGFAPCCVAAFPEAAAQPVPQRIPRHVGSDAG